MKQVTVMPVYIAAGFLFISSGMLTDSWPLRLVWSGLGMAMLLMGVLSALKQRQENGK